MFLFLLPQVLCTLLCLNTDLSFKSSALSCELVRRWHVWNLTVQKPTQMFIIKHKSSFTDLELLTLKVRCLLKCPRDLRLIFFFRCSTRSDITAGKVLNVQPEGPSVPQDRTPDVPSRSRAGAKCSGSVAAAPYLGQEPAGSPAPAEVTAAWGRAAWGHGWCSPNVWARRSLPQAGKQVVQKLLAAASCAAGRERRADRARAACSSSSAHAQ